MLIASTTASSYEPPPTGAQIARCLKVIDLGTQTSEFDGKAKHQRKVLLTWELVEQDSTGKPFQISRRFGCSLHEKASLRGFLEAWRGRPFTPTELQGFDLGKLPGAPCLLNLIEVERNGKRYCNIASISPLPKGMTAPPMVGSPVIFDIDADDAPVILETFSDGLQEAITASPEWQARLAKGSAEPTAPAVAAPPLSDFADFADDIPF